MPSNAIASTAAANANVSGEVASSSSTAPSVRMPSTPINAAIKADSTQRPDHAIPPSMNIANNAPVLYHSLGEVPGDDSAGPFPVQKGGTSAVVRSYFRKNMGSITISSDSNPGDLLMSLKLDSTLDDQSGNRNYYLKYCIDHLTLQFIATSPLGTASGTVIYGSCPDPSNSPPSGGAAMLDWLASLTGTGVQTARNNFVFTIKPQSTDGYTFKWVKSAGVPRLESYGNFAIACQVPATVPNTATFSVIVSGTMLWRDHSAISPTLPVVSYQDHTWIDISNISAFALSDQVVYQLAWPVPDNAPVGAMVHALSPSPVAWARLNLKFETGYVAPVTISLNNFKIIAAINGGVTKWYAVKPLEINATGPFTIEKYVVFGDIAPITWAIEGTTNQLSSLPAVPLTMLNSSPTVNTATDCVEYQRKAEFF